MSNYRDLAYHPETGRLEVVIMEDRGGGWYDMRFATAVTPDLSYEFTRPDPVALFEAGQKMAEALDLLSDANETLDPGDYELWEHSAAMCIKSGDIREAAEALSAWRGITRETKDG